MTEIDFNKSFYTDNFSREEFINRLEGISSIENKTISAIPFGCNKTPVEYLPNFISGNRFVEITKNYEGLQLYKLTHNIKHKEERIEEGFFFIYEHPQYNNVYIAFTIEDSQFFHYELRPYLENLYPDVVLTFIKSNKLKNLIKNFKYKNSLTEIKITRATQKLRFKEEKSMTAITWPKATLEEAFNWLYNNNGWFKSLQFEAIRNEKVLANIYINRKGIVRTYRYFNKVFEDFIQPVCKLIDNNMKLFSNRSRRENPNLAVKPLVIQYDSDVFKDIEENEIFIKSVKQIKSASVSVLHGNPYIHLSFLDYYDGSIFDIWVLNSNQIAIVPQMKGSTAAIKRLINHIFDTYAEGKIIDYESAKI